MAENDETGQRIGVDAPDEDTSAAAASTPSAAADGPPIAQRSSLPMRKASTMPDLSRFEAEQADSSGQKHSSGEAVVGESAQADFPESATPEADSAEADAAGTGTRAADTPGVPLGAAAVTTASTGSHRASGSGIAAPEATNDPAPDTAALSARPSEEEVSRRAAERDDAFTGKPVMARVFQVLLAVFFPIILLAAAIRAVTSPLFLWVEYHRPGFPADSFGFSTEDRMTYGSYTVDYILNWASPRYLGDLVNADGDQLFLDSEVGHMLDVKLVLVISFAVALAMLVFAIAACWYLARTYPGGVRRSLFAGALGTLVLMIGLTVTAVIGWQTFFTQVHALFFTDGTWTFRADDTLIRLFPAQFWMDAAITVAALVLVVTVVTLVLTWPTRARREKSRLAGEAARQRRLDSLTL
ncbi:TIGR01906 family membrane protein [Arthrobacter sp. H20]|uniref:TIGR01906 family membrane protein n=1 Tax=Arthrobacter sp. H20 TaxID=1267981 RepID=UPI00047D64DA|nr:TIGR01906 family membrane protein [Arthrobacter sp. H20]